MTNFLNDVLVQTGKRVYTSARDDGTGKPITDVEIAGSTVEEQLTEADAVAGTLTFTENLKFIGIYNTDSVNTGVFNVNGINIHVPAGESFEASIRGTPGTTVSITGATSYIVTRYV